MRRTLTLTAVLAVTALACSSSRSAPDPRKVSLDPIELKSYQGVGEALGKLVRFEGTAHNARPGALVVGDGLAVTCLGMDPWPDHMVGRKVTVSGLLERTDAFMATTGPDGTISEGTMGGDYVLKHPRLE